MSRAEELAERLEATYDHNNTNEAAAHLRALDASHQRLKEAAQISWHWMTMVEDSGAEYREDLKVVFKALEQAKDLT